MIKKASVLFTILLLVAGPFSGFSQNKSDLERERAAILKEINKTNKELSQTRASKTNALNKVLIIQQQIRNRQKLIAGYNREIELTDQNIIRTDTVISALQRDISILQEEYEKIMRAALRNKLQQSYLVFLFSSDNINDAFKRWQYLRQYDKYRKRQAEIIVFTQESLESKKVFLNNEKTKKEVLRLDLIQQNDALNAELSDKDKMLQSLKKEEKGLVSTLDKKKKAAAALEKLIEKVIREALAAASEKEENNEATTTVNTITTGQFVNARGRLPWPVPQGKISKPYGINRHPKFKNVKTTNNGKDISTDVNASVKSIFAGKVAGVQFIPGYKNTVIVQHGKYYTVYSNLASIYVKRGDQIEAQQVIGKVGDSEPEVHLEIWREKERLDPTQWIIRK